MDVAQDLFGARTSRRGRRGAPRRRGGLLLAGAVAVALVAGCGNGGDGEEPAPAAGTDRVTVAETSVVLGNADAEQRVHVFQDLNCPHCQVLHGVMVPDVERWTDGDDVAVEVTVVDYLGPRTTHGFSTRGAQLLALVADRDPAAWPTVQDALLAMQPATTTEEISDDALFAAADAASIGEVTAADLAEYGPQVAQATAEAAEAGVNFIPQVFVDGELVGGASHDETAALVRAALGE